MNKLSRFLVLAIAASASLFAFSQSGLEGYFNRRNLSDPMLIPGDTIGNMLITTGVKNAVPLWDVCSSTEENEHTVRVDCGELSGANLAIGYAFGVTDLARQCIDWKAFKWEMSVDGHPIDLEAFGVHDFVYPDLAPRPSPVREVFKTSRLWNVILVNPTPGTHEVQGRAESDDGAAIYTWVVNLSIAAR